MWILYLILLWLDRFRIDTNRSLIEQGIEIMRLQWTSFQSFKKLSVNLLNKIVENKSGRKVILNFNRPTVNSAGCRT